MHHSQQKTVRNFAYRIRHALQAIEKHGIDIRRYDPKRDGAPKVPWDPRCEEHVYFLRYSSKRLRSAYQLFGHDYSYSVTLDGLRLRVTMNDVSKRQERILLHILTHIADAHDIVIMVDVAKSHKGTAMDMLNKYRIRPGGPKLKRI